jgi:tRNA(Ile)-lysidine synthase TilS/MesJ
MFKLKPLLNYDEIWVAVSMGIDSLSLFNFLSNNLHKRIVAFHINHKMIPEDDEIEQNFPITQFSILEFEFTYE